MLCFGKKAADWWRAMPFLQFYQCYIALCFGYKLVLVFWRGTRKDNLFLLQLCRPKLIELDWGFGKCVIVIYFWQVIFRFFFCRLWIQKGYCVMQVRYLSVWRCFNSFSSSEFTSLLIYDCHTNFWSGSTNFWLSKTISTLVDKKIYTRCYLFLLANVGEMYCWVAPLSDKCVHLIF